MKSIKYFIKSVIFKLSFFNTFREFMALYVEKRSLKESDYEKMKKCCNIVEECNLFYRIADGTVLGLYRENSFIAHDDDVDIDVLNATKKQIKSLEKKLMMKIGRKVIYKNRTQQIAFYDKDGFIFDVVFWYESNGEIYNYCENNYERTQSISFFEKKSLTFLEFKGKKYPIPTPIEPWLEMRYGKDWKIPKKYKGDWKNECFDMVKLK